VTTAVPRAKELSSAQSLPAIATYGVGWRAGQAQILSDITLEVHPGEFLSIIGPNGAGKSTYINMLAGQIQPSAGRVEVGGVDVSRYRPARRTKLGLGRAYQVASLFPELTVLENARLAAQISIGGALSPWRKPRTGDAATERAQLVLATVGLEKAAAVSTAKLSHGDKKKLDIALALCSEPKVLLLDEPTAGVSAEDIDDLMAALGRFHSAGVTVVMVEHHIEIVTDMSDRIAVLQEGRLLLCDTPERVVASEDVRRAYLGTGADE